MNDKLKKLLRNPALGILERNAAERLKRSGIRLGEDSGLPTPQEHPQEKDASGRVPSSTHL
jgi:hypothetical protein